MDSRREIKLELKRCGPFSARHIRQGVIHAVRHGNHRTAARLFTKNCFEHEIERVPEFCAAARLLYLFDSLKKQRAIRGQVRDKLRRVRKSHYAYAVAGPRGFYK